MAVGFSSGGEEKLRIWAFKSGCVKWYMNNIFLKNHSNAHQHLHISSQKKDHVTSHALLTVFVISV